MTRIIGTLILALVLASTAVAGETDSKAREVIREAILAADYVCPEVGKADVKGQTNEGIRVKAWCRPMRGSDVYDPKLVYWVTIRPSGRAEVTPTTPLGW